jgi:Cu/Ag efflux protein CusF
MPHVPGRSLFPVLLPAILAACVNTGPAAANPPAAPPLGVDLGGAPARSVGAVELAAAQAAPATGIDAMTGTGAMAGMDHSAHGPAAGEMQMAHEGHGGAHGTGTVTAVDIAQRKIGMQHEPIPALGWPSMTMEFAVAPSVNLQAVQPGARIEFSLEKGPDGMYVIQSVQPAGRAR